MDGPGHVGSLTSGRNGPENGTGVHGAAISHSQAHSHIYTQRHRQRIVVATAH